MSDFAVLGGPGLVRTWVEELLKRAKTATKRKVNFLAVDFKSEPVNDIAENADRLWLVREPATWLAARIAAGSIRTVVALEDPLDAFAFSRTYKGTLLEAVRDQSAATAATLILADNPAVLFVVRWTEVPARHVATQMLLHLGFVVTEPALLAVVDTLAGTAQQALSLESVLAARGGKYTPQRRSTIDFSEDAEAAAASLALDPFVAKLTGGDLAPIVWPVDLLLDGDDFVRPARRICDLTGPARNLVRGPYLCLPPGRYACRYIMRFLRDGADTRYALEIHGKRLLQRQLFTPPVEGTFALECDLDIDAPDHWIDLRFRLEEGAIGGEVAVERAELQWQGPPQ